jgi:hypothetical protein
MSAYCDLQEKTHHMDNNDLIKSNHGSLSVKVVPRALNPGGANTNFRSTYVLSLCDISKLSKSSINEILNYRYRDIDSCLTDSSIVCPSVSKAMKKRKSLK